MAGADFFFYGTLRDADILARVLGHAVPSRRLAPARLAGWRAVFVENAWYPGLVADAAGEAPGVLMAGPTAAETAALMAYEDTDYTLAALRVDVAGAVRAARVFLPGPAMRLTAEPWDLADWQYRFKSRVLARWG